MTDWILFCQYVRSAFAHIHDVGHLRTHPLTAILARKEQNLSGVQLRRVLLDAIEQLVPPSDAPQHAAICRQYRYLRLRYVDGASHDDISRQLLVSTRQARRDHLEALTSVSSVLWQSRRTKASDPIPTSPSVDSRKDVPCNSLAIETALDTELLKAEFTATGKHCDLLELLADVTTFAGKLAESLGGGLRDSLPSVLSPAAVDRTILRQILLSLLSFAIETEPTHRIAFSALDRGDTVRLRIAPDEERKRTSARRIHPVASLEVEALIATAQHLANLQGVSLEFSHVSGQTSSIDVTVPVAYPQTVLLVDDNPDIGRLFERYLQDTTYRVLQAKTWRRAVRLAATDAPNVIILDIMMPSQDGWDILRQLKADPNTAEIPVVICSVLPEKSLALAVGATDFLAKPVNQTSLLAALHHCQSLVIEARQGSL